MRPFACPWVFFALVGAACGGGDDDGGSGESGSGVTATMGTDPGGTTSTDGGPSGDPSGSGPASTSSGPSATDTGPLDSSSGDSGSSETSAGGEPGDWLLTVDNGTSPPRLTRVDLDGGSVSACGLATSVNYNSIALTRDGTLYGHNAAASRLDRINPCDCSFQIVGSTSLGTISLGLDATDGLLGIYPTLDALVEVDPQTALASIVGPVGAPFESASLAWSDLAGQPYAVEASTDSLYAVDVTTGAATLLHTLTADLINPGLAVHPNDDALYLCDGNSLYRVDPGSGALMMLGGLGLMGSCTTLTAPQAALACIDAL